MLNLHKHEFTISNVAGGSEKKFRLVLGHISFRALQHALLVGYGGPIFDGPAAKQAYHDWTAREREK